MYICMGAKPVCVEEELVAPTSLAQVVRVRKSLLEMIVY